MCKYDWLTLGNDNSTIGLSMYHNMIDHAVGHVKYESLIGMIRFAQFKGKQYILIRLEMGHR